LAAFDKQITLERLRELRQRKELTDGFPDKRSCFAWAAQVEPLLAFNVSYKIQFGTNLQVLHRNVSSYTAEPALEEMITVLQMAIHQLEHELAAEPKREPLKVASPVGDYANQSRIAELRAVAGPNS
jgi:hypothetical protein